MYKKESKSISIDPRTLLFLLLFANVITFFQNSLWIELGWICFLGITMLFSGNYVMAVRCMVLYGILIVFQYILLPAAPKVIATTFIMMINYSRRMFPCLMVGAFMIRTISLRQFVLAMRKLHIPQKMIIPISVTIRYFPAIKEEINHIKDAIRLRDIKPADKLEALIVPLMMSATATAEELSAAAVTRGIENPIKKTSTIDLKFRLPDYLCTTLGILFCIGVFLIK